MLALKMSVDPGSDNTRGLSDIRQAHRVISALGEQFRCGGHDLLGPFRIANPARNASQLLTTFHVSSPNIVLRSGRSVRACGR